MAVCYSRIHPQSLNHPIFLIAIFLFLIIPFAASLSFNFNSFGPNDNNITYERAAPAEGAIELTRNQRDKPMDTSMGRATYSKPLQLWYKASGSLTDFTTHFSFVIYALNETSYADGIAFFLAPVGSKIPNNATKGIDINSMQSVTNVAWSSSILDGKMNDVWISYDSSSKNLSVVFTGFRGNSTIQQNLYYILDLRDHLPEQVTFGFSAATGYASAVHRIHSWNFSSSLEIDENIPSPTDPVMPPSANPDPKPTKNKTGLVAGSTAGACVLVGVLGLALFSFWKKKKEKEREKERERERDKERREDEDHDLVFDVSMNEEFERGTGPKKFSYNELAIATKNFAEEEKLGEGGFGAVYRGFLRDLNSYVAVKRVSRGSKQGIKEYASEVKIISRLRHRNLVQLMGWCHEGRELLLVYEFMPNGSLDFHLFKENSLLTWVMRYNIAQGLASALFYLHEEWEQCVLHRDVKSSNIMLDANFNAKLGDFGLARLVDHGKVSQTTVLAGTMGYMAPECLMTGKASKQSDVYSFGIVALEIACGRKPINPKADEGQIRMVDWVWELYGMGKLLNAADPRLCSDFDEEQLQCLIIVGLWCAHPDCNLRPSIKQAIQVLNFDAPLPNLPPKMPLPTYIAPPVNISAFSISSSSCGATDSEGGQNQSSSSDYNTNSSKRTASSSASSVSALLLYAQ
ncbi:hypothetical protein F0562_028847 [Nyssa sinensis]|uniref:Protein kinase domain-containing protein n=1 Tax=Nyssa sinensis TaxID=561372 RepID=A0A5J5B102_9ASTE|nr:hypothetical protein F0562_028847 [Nyssa sinensis]